MEHEKDRDRSPKRRRKKPEVGNYQDARADANSGDMSVVDKEAHRIEVLRRRKAMEVEQLIAFESSRREMEKIEEAKVRDTIIICQGYTFKFPLNLQSK